MRLHVADHPLIDHKLSVLRDERTPSAVFRQLVDELVTLLAYEATREVRTEEVEIRTPVALAQCRRLADPRPIVVPILRAGLGMLEGMTRLLPTAEVGFLGMKRDEDTLEVETYANRLPDDLSGRQCFVVDPMLATGHTLVAAIDYLLERGARDVTALCLIAAPEGVKTLEDAVGERANVTVGTAGGDERAHWLVYDGACAQHDWRDLRCHQLDRDLALQEGGGQAAGSRGRAARGAARLGCGGAQGPHPNLSSAGAAAERPGQLSGTRANQRQPK